MRLSILSLWVLGLVALVAAQQSADWQALGEETYAAQCASCHQADGGGVEGVYPSLVSSELLLDDPAQVINLILNGKGTMPAFGSLLDDEQIAAVISHERNSWGNEASVVSPEMVASSRASAGEGDNGESSMMAVSLPEGWHDQAAQLYTDNCAACHQAQGEGVEGAFPALAGNAYVMSEPASVIALLLHGRGGMPSFQGGLSGEEIAYVLSYVRTSWDNESSLIGPEMVEAVAEGRLSPSDPNDPNYRPGAAN